MTWLFVALVHIFGLSSTLVVRWGYGTEHENWCQTIYYTTLAMIGLVTGSAMLVCPACGTLLGLALCVMVVGAVLDFGGQRELSSV